MKRYAIAWLVLLPWPPHLTAPAFAQPPALSFETGKPIPPWNALFEQKEGWIGADGAHSVALGAQRRLWLFSDTWVGSIREGKRFDATIINNSVGLQEGADPAAPVRFIYGQKAGNKPAAWIEPAKGPGWYWLQAGRYANKKVYLFLSQIEKTNDTSVFGFRQTGQSLGIVGNPEDDPAAWKIEQHKLPCTIFSKERELTFGASLLEDQEFLYIYGTDEDVKPAGRDRFLIVARVGIAQIADFAAWRFFDGDGWNADFRKVKRLVPQMASECSVTYLNALKPYLLVYTEGGLSRRILVRTAPAPTGPWPASTIVFECPEGAKDKRLFCYGAKAHPSLATGNELIISYIANSFDFWQVASDAKIYLPRFIRVKWRAEK